MVGCSRCKGKYSSWLVCEVFTILAYGSRFPLLRTKCLDILHTFRCFPEPNALDSEFGRGKLIWLKIINWSDLDRSWLWLWFLHILQWDLLLNGSQSSVPVFPKEKTASRQEQRCPCLRKEWDWQGKGESMMVWRFSCPRFFTCIGSSKETKKHKEMVCGGLGAVNLFS